MKKTIALLLAAASMAMGATPISVTWNGNTATYAGTEISAIFTLDVTALADGGVFTFAPLGAPEEIQYGIFNTYDGFYGENAISDITPGVYHDGSLIDVWVEYDSGYKAQSAIVAYSFSKGGNASIQFTMFDNKGNVCYEKINSIESPALDFTSITSLTKGSAVGKIDIYDTALGVEEFAAAIEYLKNPTVQPDGPDTPVEPSEPAVPEPTTATLSLLALSALAARRRRK